MRGHKKTCNLPTLIWLLLFLSLGFSALLMALSIRSASHFYVHCVVLFPLLVTIRVCRPIMAALAAATWAAMLLASCLAGLGPSIPLTPATFFLVLLMPSLFVGLGSWATRKIGFSPLVLATGWFLLESALRPALVLREGEWVGRELVLWFGSAAAPLLVGFCLAWVNAELVLLADLLTKSPGRLPAPIEKIFLLPLCRVLEARMLTLANDSEARAPPHGG